LPYRRRAFALCFLGLAGACTPAEYTCRRDLECVGELGELGACVASRCAHADAECPTGRRFDGGACVHEIVLLEERVSDHLDAHPAALRSFKHEPVGSAGVPMVVFRLLPDVMPDLWGDGYAAAGFAPDPAAPERPLPLGLGFMPGPTEVATPLGPVRLSVATLTCAACHTGRVRVAGRERTLIGAPSGQILGFHALLTRTVRDARFDAAGFRAALAARPPGWIYLDPAHPGQERAEREVYLAAGGGEAIVEAFRRAVLRRQEIVDSTVGRFVDGRAPNPPPRDAQTPGHLDALAEAVALLIDPAQATPELLDRMLAPAPAPVDPMSLFRLRQRPAAQWDGSLVDALHGGLGSSLGVVVDPRRANVAGAIQAVRLLADLPPPPYPFPIDAARAARGAAVFTERCAGCHRAGNDAVYPDIGTDANRLRALTPEAAVAVRGALGAACTDPSSCPDEATVRVTGGYMAPPLDGIWTRAPYLHNGSVPTLRALLSRDRPATFHRGNLDYDPQGVGFVWDRAVDPGARRYDTAYDGQSNAGHEIFVEGEALEDLLEHLKTL
jgi:hypothetical protein